MVHIKMVKHDIGLKRWLEMLDHPLNMGLSSVLLILLYLVS